MDAAQKSRIVISFRLPLAVTSCVGLLMWTYFVLLLRAYAGWPVFDGSMVITILFGYTYLLFSFYCSIRKPSVKTVWVVGVALNASLLAAIVYLLEIERGLMPGHLFLGALVLSWITLWVGRVIEARALTEDENAQLHLLR